MMRPEIHYLRHSFAVCRALLWQARRTDRAKLVLTRPLNIAAPAKTGVQWIQWIPVFAGMTNAECLRAGLIMVTAASKFEQFAQPGEVGHAD